MHPVAHALGSSPAARAESALIAAEGDVLVHAEQVKALYQPRRRMSIVALAAGLLLAGGMSREVPLGTLGLWFMSLCAAQSYILFLYLSYIRTAPPPERSASWGHKLLIALFLAGSAWGSAGIVMFQPELSANQMLLILGLFMVAMSTMAGGLTAHMPAVYVFVFPTVVPLLARSALQGDFEHWVLTGAGTLLLVLIIYYALHLNSLIKESIRMRFENLERLRENERLLLALERERQQVLAARDRAEGASRAKSRFLAAASHDLRQPLHTLSLYSAALKLAPDANKGDIAAHIEKALASVSALVDSLLDISKLDAGAVHPDLQHVPIRDVLERIRADYAPVAREKNLEFSVVPADAVVKTDPVLLGRLLTNLVDNAFKYTLHGSVVLAAEVHDGTVRITVRDSGIGIPAYERERIFEEFYQIGNPERDRSEGLGLGLAIVRRLSVLLGVQLELESEPGGGSAFHAELPLAPASAQPALPAADTIGAESRRLEGAHVLVIDDEAEVRLGMRTLLEHLGCQVMTCSGYLEAEELINREAFDPHLVIVDFRLRRHENGIETVRRLRQIVGEVPALLVTGDTAPERLREARASGLPLLHKPVSVEKLTETMLSLLTPNDSPVEEPAGRAMSDSKPSSERCDREQPFRLP